MPRDMDLVRLLLLKVEKLDLPPGVFEPIDYGDDWFEIEGYARNQAVDNLRMLHDGGFIAGKGPMMQAFVVVGLTWKGAELLDTIRNPEVWSRTKAAGKAAGGFALDLLMQVAKAEARRFATEKLGIPL